MKCQDIMVIASDFDLYNLTLELIQELNLQEIGVIHAFLDDAVSESYKLQAQGVKLLVSRGGTAKKIMESQVRVPLLQIPITHLDVIRLIAEAKQTSRRMAIVGFTDPLVKTASLLGSILDVEIREYIVDTKHDVGLKVLKAIEDGAEVIIGAQLAVSCARQYGIPSVLLKTPREVVLNSLEEAKKMVAALRREREWGEQQKTILDTISQGILAFDENGLITTTNSVARDYLPRLEQTALDDQLFGLRLRSCFHNQEILTGEIGRHNGERYVCNMKYTVVDGKNKGGIFSFQKLSSFQEIESKTRRSLMEKGLNAKYCFADILSTDPVMARLLQTCRNYAPLASTVLIYGESGTGKELIAQSIHNESTRRTMPFVAVNCAALPENLLESELFGYIEGAFTGAKKGGKTGLFELAHQGTLFLDEIGEVSPPVQARLLRVLEERQIIRLGDDRIIPIDVRIICATNKDLKTLSREGSFRSDLYYRINVLKIVLPALRDRRADIPLLCQHFLQKLSAQLQVSPPRLTDAAQTALSAYSWPGNIRELRNIMERITINHHGAIVQRQDLYPLVEELDAGAAAADKQVEGEQGLIQKNEQQLIREALQNTAGNKSKAAELLGISPATLWRKLKKYDI